MICTTELLVLVPVPHAHCHTTFLELQIQKVTMLYLQTQRVFQADNVTNSKRHTQRGSE